MQSANPSLAFLVAEPPALCFADHGELAYLDSQVFVLAGAQAPCGGTLCRWLAIGLIMVALCNRADHYIFILFLLSSFFFFLA